MEMVFRKIEYWIEGTAEHQRKLNRGPLTREKIIKKSFKHLIFFAFSFLVGNTFLSYIIGAVSYTHLRAHETVLDIVCRLLLEKKKRKHTTI